MRKNLRKNFAVCEKCIIFAADFKTESRDKGTKNN